MALTTALSLTFWKISEIKFFRNFNLRNPLKIPNFHQQLVAIVFIGLTTNSAFAKNSGLEIMRKVDSQSKKYLTQESEVFMLITDKNSKERKRYFLHKKKINGDETKSLIKFYKPSNVKGTALLTNAPSNSSTNKQWVYFPALRSIKQLSTKDQNNSFMGSDFSYSDIAGRQIEKDNHKLLKTTDKYFIIESIPKDKKDSYSKLELVIDKKLYVILRIKFFNQKQQKLKTLTNQKIDKIKKMYVVTKSTMENHLNNSKTILDISDVQLGIKLTNHDISIKALK